MSVKTRPRRRSHGNATFPPIRSAQEIPDAAGTGARSAQMRSHPLENRMQIQIAFRGLRMDVSADYIPGEITRFDCPMEDASEGYPDEIEIRRVIVAGVDVVAWLNDEIFEEIESFCLRAIKQQAKDSRSEALIEREIYRREA